MSVSNHLKGHKKRVEKWKIFFNYLITIFCLWRFPRIRFRILVVVEKQQNYYILFGEQRQRHRDRVRGNNKQFVHLHTHHSCQRYDTHKHFTSCEASNCGSVAQTGSDDNLFHFFPTFFFICHFLCWNAYKCLNGPNVRLEFRCTTENNKHSGPTNGTVLYKMLTHLFTNTNYSENTRNENTALPNRHRMCIQSCANTRTVLTQTHTHTHARADPNTGRIAVSARFKVVV